MLIIISCRATSADHSSLPQEGVFTEVCVRPASLSALGFRSQEALRAVRPQLYGDLEPVHLVVKDTGEQVIALSMQLIAGRTAQEYNLR